MKRVAVIVPLLGVPSEIWIERQALAFRNVSPVLMAWKRYPGWLPDPRLEIRMLRGQFEPPRTLVRRIARHLGLPRALKPTRTQVEELRAAILDAGVDAVLCHFAWTAIAVAPSLPAGMPLLIHVHGRDVSMYLKRPSYRRALKPVLNRAQSLVAVGNHQIERLESVGRPARTSVIPCGAPGEIFSFSAMPHHSDDGPVRFISVGRMSVEKGMHETLRAFEAVAEHAPKAELVLIGFGPELEPLRRLAGSSRFAERIRLPGQLNPQEIAKELASAQVYLQHSREVGGWVEGFGVTLAEAGAAGLPLLASASGGLIDQIEIGENGFLFPQGDVGAQAALMRRLLDDPALRRRLGQQARRLAGRFDTRLMVAKLEAEILTVIKAAGS